jgi:hypothetical protein
MSDIPTFKGNLLKWDSAIGNDGGFSPIVEKFAKHGSR